MDTQNGLSAKAQDDGQVRYVAYESVVDPTSKKELFMVVVGSIPQLPPDVETVLHVCEIIAPSVERSGTKWLPTLDAKDGSKYEFANTSAISFTDALLTLGKKYPDATWFMGVALVNDCVAVIKVMHSELPDLSGVEKY